MRDIMISALRASLVTWVLCGIAYPLALTGLGQWLMPIQANGSLERSPDGTIIGSWLIGQFWNDPEWFHGRPSATTGADPNDPTKRPRPRDLWRAARECPGPEFGPAARLPSTVVVASCALWPPKIQKVGCPRNRL